MIQVLSFYMKFQFPTHKIRWKTLSKADQQLFYDTFYQNPVPDNC